jgi:hypothetical protein
MKDIRRRDEIMAAFAAGLTLAGQGMKAVSDATRKAADALQAAAATIDSQPVEVDETVPTAPPVPTPEPTPEDGMPDPDMPYSPELPPEGTGPYDQPTRGPYDPPNEPPQNP